MGVGGSIKSVAAGGANRRTGFALEFGQEFNDADVFQSVTGKFRFFRVHCCFKRTHNSGSLSTVSRICSAIAFQLLGGCGGKDDNRS